MPEKTLKYAEYSQFHFSIADYCVFVAMLLFSTGTGIYFGYIRKKIEPVNPIANLQLNNHKEPDFGSKAMSEYLLGSRRLKVFPVAMSLVASYISGVTMLGVPSEIYNYGTQYWLIVVPVILMAFVVSKVYLPVFSALNVGSSYEIKRQLIALTSVVLVELFTVFINEALDMRVNKLQNLHCEYLEMRFSSSVRSAVSFMFVMDEVFFLPIILYVPAIAFNQVTGVNIYVISGIICVVCVIYTLIGGIKAVVHTDAWQTLVMFIALVVVVILGTIAAGGPGPVFKHASEGGRLIFLNINPSLYERQSIWGVLIGGFTYWTAFNSVNQTMVQRYMSLPTLKRGQSSIIIFTCGILLFISVCCFAGLLVFDFYQNCDPLKAGLISNDDQLLPIYVMQTVGHLKGIPGLFIAGVFGAALSSLSVVLNSTALVFLQDIVRGSFKVKLSERATTVFVKSVIVFLGVVSMALIFVLEKLSGILSVATSVTAIAAGTSFGIFTLGMLVPWSNTKGALAGGAAGALMSGWVAFGSQAVIAAGRVGPHKLEASVSACLVNATIPERDYGDESEVFPLYRLSFHWITVIGVLSTLLVGTVTSFLTGPTVVKTLDAELISPVIHRFLPKECFPPPNTHPDLSPDHTAQPLTHLLANGERLSDVGRY